MSSRRAPAAGVLVAVDGSSGTAIVAAARRVLSSARPRRGGISHWDASGLFEQLLVAGDEAGIASARTLLLLYAADLAFRLRWEIEPALAKGHTVVAAPYVNTAIAFGRAAGLDHDWLATLFKFAARPADRRIVATPMPLRAGALKGFVEFGCGILAGRQLRMSRKELAARTRAQLIATATRTRARRAVR